MSCRMLKLVRPAQRKEVVQALEKMLHDAKAGDLTGFSGISVSKDKVVTHYFVGRCAETPFESVESLYRLVENIRG